MQTMTYKRRHNPLARGEREWRAEEKDLVTRSAAGRERRLPWREVASVRLCHEPARGRPWRYVFEIQPRHGARIELDNAHLVRRGLYEDRSAAFSPFVRAAIARVAAESPNARALIGETPKSYFFLLLASLLGFCAMAITLSVVRTPLDALPFANPIKLALVLLTLPIFWRWVVGAMPRGVALDQIPPRALPPEPS